MIDKLFKGDYTTKEIAQNLLGKLLVHEKDGKRVSGFIVETEAYLGIEDMAAHSFGGRKTERTYAMFQEAGTLYVHVMHTHVLLNIITQEKGVPEGVLIRAIEPFEGIGIMEENRIKHGYQLTNGPGNLTKALGITMKYYGESIFGKQVFIDESFSRKPKKILSSPRIGIANKGIWTEKELRFFVEGNPYVSRRKGKIASDSGWL